MTTDYRPHMRNIIIDIQQNASKQRSAVVRQWSAVNHKKQPIYDHKN